MPLSGSLLRGSNGSWLRCQRVVLALGCEAGNAAGVGFVSKLSTSLFQPSLHVGKQIGGGGGWRSDDVSGGTAAGASDESCGAVPQAAADSRSTQTSSGRQRRQALGFIVDLRLRGDAPLLLDHGSLGGLALDDSYDVGVMTLDSDARPE
jgi:hypothetical protein